MWLCTVMLVIFGKWWNQLYPPHVIRIKMFVKPIKHYVCVLTVPWFGNRQAIWPIKTPPSHLSAKVLFQNKGRKNTYWISLPRFTWQIAGETKVMVDRSLIHFPAWWHGVLTSFGVLFLSQTINTGCLVVHFVQNLQCITVCLNCTSFVLFSLHELYFQYVGRLFWVDLIKWVSNVCPYVRPSVRPQKVSSIAVKFGT